MGDGTVHSASQARIRQVPVCTLGCRGEQDRFCPQAADLVVCHSPSTPHPRTPAPGMIPKGPSPACRDAASLDKGGGRRNRAKSTSPGTEGERGGGEIWHGDKGGSRELVRGKMALACCSHEGAGNHCGGLPAEMPEDRSPDTQERRLGKGTSQDEGVPGPRACKNTDGQHIPECPGKEEEKVKKGPECREPRL